MASGCRDPVRDATVAQIAKQLDRAGERTAIGEERPEELAVSGLDALRFIVGQRPSRLPRNRPSEEPAAHSDTPVDLPTVDCQSRFSERPLPGEDVAVDRIDERPVEIEDECPPGVPPQRADLRR